MLGVGSLMSGWTTPGAPLGIVFLLFGDAGTATGLGVGCEWQERSTLSKNPAWL